MTFFQGMLATVLVLYFSLVSVICTEESDRVSTSSWSRNDESVVSECKAEEEERVVMGYSDSWAVEVQGGVDEANRIAAEHGFVNLGQVGRLEGVYHFALMHFEARNSSKMANQRSGTLHTIQRLDKTTELRAEENVYLSVQQKMFRKQKRGFMYPVDPLWNEQWALFNLYGSYSGRDLNVVPAWIQGYTGQGVVVSVVDDGLQSSHPDLSTNFDSSASYNYVESVSDPSPYSLYDSHGTSCAGEIGMAKDNDYCGVGVAYNCNLGGIRVNLNYLTDITEAQALSYRDNYIQIYSNSWGPPDNGFLVQGPGYYSSRTLQEGVSKGRNGLGTLWVWASGNGGRQGDSCAADGYASSMYTIAVGSADPQGRQAYYDEDCSGKMAVTFSYSSSSYTQLVSTTLQGQCTTTFTGTSASAPLAAGVIALVLEANSNLSWRDIQYLIAYTSDPSPFLSVSGWSTNGAGLLFSNKFGFGVMDAEAMVTRAQHWNSVPQRRSCTFQPDTTSNDKSSATSGDPLTVEFSVDSNCNVLFLEHVVVQMTLDITVSSGGTYSYYDYFDDPSVMYHNGPKRGHISVELYSPYGTRSVLLPERQNDFVNAKGYYNWPFMSLHYWGEDPVGDWKLVVYFATDAGYVTADGIEVALYGTSEVPDSIQRIPEECDSSCVRGCAAEGGEYCDSCRRQRIKKSLQCVDACPGEVSRQDPNQTNACSVGGYCIDCKKTLQLSLPFIVLVAVSGLVLVVASITVAIVILTKLCLGKSHQDYVKI